MTTKAVWLKVEPILYFLASVYLFFRGRVAQPFRLGFLFPISKLRVPRSCVFCKGGYDAADTMGF